MVGRSRGSHKDAFDRYLEDIEKIPMLRPGQDFYLGYWMQEDPGFFEEGREALIKGNLRFVIRVAKKFAHDVPLPDLVQAGNKGLIEAAGRYDAGRKVKFISYAVWWIRQSIFSELANTASIARIPLNQAGEVAKINKQIDYFRKLGFTERNAIEAAIDKNLNIDTDSLEQKVDAERATYKDRVANLRSLRRPVYLDAPVKEGSDTTFGGVIRSRDEDLATQVEQSTQRQYLNTLIARLEPRDKKIIELYYGEEDLTLEEIGSRLGVTRERIRQVRDRALERLQVIARQIPYKAQLLQGTAELRYRLENRRTGTE